MGAAEDGVEAEDGVLVTDLPRARSSAGCSRRPTIIRAHTIPAPATTTDLEPGMQWATACNGSDLMIRAAERI